MEEIKNIKIKMRLWQISQNKIQIMIIKALNIYNKITIQI